MMDHTLLLHIGMPKTGTTTLQNFLYQNRDKLKDYGWSYPDLYEDMYPGNDQSYAKYGFKNGYLFNPSNYRSLSRKQKRKLEILLHNYLADHNVIISEECIWGSDSEKVIADLIRCQRNHRIVILVYLRRQDFFKESFWNEAVKGSLEWRKIDEYVQYLEEGKDAFEYLKKIRILDRLVGKDNIIIRVFEKEQFEGARGDVISDFLTVISRLGNPIDQDRLIYSENANESISGYALSATLLFNEEYHRNSSVPLYDKMIPLLERIRRKDDYEEKEEGRYLTKEERVNILSYYANDNATIAREYLNRDSGELFYDKRVDFPIWEPYEFDDWERNLIVEMARYMSACSNGFLREKEEVANGIKKCAKLLFFAIWRRISHVFTSRSA